MKNTKVICCSCNRPFPTSDIKEPIDMIYPILEQNIVNLNSLTIELPIRN